MASSPAKRCDLVAALFLAFATLFRFWYAGQHELVQDEAYYWQWSRHLAPGYYDNTPVMAFVIRFFTTLLGTNETGVRAGAIVSALVASVFLYLLARRLLRAQIALLAVVVANIIPLFAAGAVLMTQDPVQLAFWSATLYVAWLAVDPPRPAAASPAADSPNPQSPFPTREGGANYTGSFPNRRKRWGLWLLAGALAGLTAMSKLNGLLLLPSVFLYLCLAPSARRWLKHPAPYIAATLSLALFAPFIWWNHTHGNAFWTHIHAMGSRGEENGFTLRWLGEFVGAQAVLVSPLLFLTYLAILTLRGTPNPPYPFPKRKGEPTIEGSFPEKNAGLVSSEQSKEGLLFLWCLSVVVFVATLALSLHSRVEGNWAVAAYISGMIFVAATIAGQWAKPIGKIWHGLSIGIALGLTLIVLFPAIGYSLGLRLDHANDRTNELYGWKPMADQVDDLRNTLGGPGKCFVFGVNYRVPSELAFYLPDHPETYSLFLHDRANEYMFWENEKELVGKNAVFVNVSDTAEHLADCRAVFERVVRQPPLYVYRSPYKQPIRVIQIFACYGFKGYDRHVWQQGW